MKHILLFGLFVILCLNPTFGQDSEDQVFNFFALQKDKNVILHFTLRKGVSCDGIIIERSLDGDHFEKIHKIPGICGDNVVDESYNYIDTHPNISETNYYRINLGSFIFSDVISILPFNFKNKHYWILNNPVSNMLSIQFENDYFKYDYRISIYDIGGKRIIEKQLNGNPMQLSINELPRSIYFFNIIDEKSTTSGKFIKH